MSGKPLWTLIGLLVAAVVIVWSLPRKPKREMLGVERSVTCYSNGTVMYDGIAESKPFEGEGWISFKDFDTGENVHLGGNPQCVIRRLKEK